LFLQTFLHSNQNPTLSFFQKYKFKTAF